MATNPWSYTSGTSDTPLLGITIGDMFDQTVARYPDNEALVSRHQGLRYTYRQLRARSTAAPARSWRLGVNKGERRGHLGAQLRRVDDHPVRHRQDRRDPRQHQPELSAPRSRSTRSGSPAARRSSSRRISRPPTTPAMMHELAPGAGAQPARPSRRGQLPRPARRDPARRRARRRACWRGGALLALAERVGADELAARQRQQEFDDPINIQYTSGTTGYPKGATLSHHNILNNGYFVTELLRFTDRDRLLIPVPLYHCFGMVMGNLGCMTHGATMIYPSDGFDPPAVLEAVQAERATALYGVPTMFIAELNHPDFAQLRPLHACAPASWPARPARSR